MAVALTAGIWGLPGQLTRRDAHCGRIDLFVVLGVALANARFLPMVVSFMPDAGQIAATGVKFCAGANA